MKKVERVSSYQVLEFVYSSQEYREAHVEDMENQGWKCTGQIKRVKPDIDVLGLAELKDSDLEHYAKFTREMV